MARTLFLFFLIFSGSSVHSQEKKDNWFPFQPTGNYAPSRINMQSWLDAPAGRHGFLQMKKDDLQFADGTPVKFWGVNIASNRPFVEKEEAEHWARFIASYGINAVRFHKFTWEATDGIHSTQLTEQKWRNFDYFCSQLKETGIYYAWSHIYGHRVRPGDSSRLLSYSEVAGTKFPWSHLNATTASLVNFAEDLQELNIELTVNMLNHQNPVTGLRYADDPALAYIELQNEDNIFWSAIEATMKQTPTYRKLLTKKFSHWLKAKYNHQEALEKAWGPGVLPEGENLQQENIYPQPAHGFFTAESEKAWKAGSALPSHVADKAAFLYEEQAKFYDRFVKAVRATGYKGLIVSSGWQAGSGLAHLWNIYADYQVGPIDRHNYFGGGTGHTLKAGKVNNSAMVSTPGSGLLSTGFQQVKDRPFFLSEWMSLIPTEWIAESAPIIAAYGLGLQGWDASFSFAMDYSHFTNTVQSGHGVYNVTSPTHLALYPALAAMIYRNDVEKGPVVAERRISVDELAKGVLPFYEKVEQESDIKQLQSSVPLDRLANGRIVLTFVEKGKAGVELAKEAAAQNEQTVVSATGQLQWHKVGKGYFSINTNGTQGMVGFLPKQATRLNDISLQSPNEFAVVLLTSLEKEQSIAAAKRLLVTTVARAHNTGMKYNADKTELLEVGKSPILLEPVHVELIFKNAKGLTIHVLDHTGNRTGEKVPVQNGKAVLDGGRYKAIYYEVERGTGSR